MVHILPVLVLECSVVSVPDVFLRLIVLKIQASYNLDLKTIVKVISSKPHYE